MLSISSYFSFLFLAAFLPITIGLYAVMPQKIRRWVILLSGWLFFLAVSGKLIAYLIFSILSIYFIGLWLSRLQAKEDKQLQNVERNEKKRLKGAFQKKQVRVVAFGICLNIGILIFLKYSAFFAVNINRLLEMLNVSFSLNVPFFILPIGISFYTMQAAAYLFDVYRRKIPADKNLMRIALYMSFFPQLMEGPICRYSDTAERLWEAEPIKYKNLTFGLQRILFGLMKKLVVADRLNLFIKNVFDNYTSYDGFVIALAAVGYTIQLYMDFSGTMDAAMGMGQIFGITLPENFKRPFFSRTISEFWKRWHITLGTWFKDYIFFPLSMSKPLKKLALRARKKLGNHFGPLISASIALFAVWLCNGLWHGAGWHYIFFGMYHFVLILFGNIIEPLAIKTTKMLHISRKCLPYRCFQIVRTSLLVCIGELFFRANGLWAGLRMSKRIVTNFTLTTLNDRTLFTFGMDKRDFLIVFLVVIIIFIIGIIKERGGHIREAIARRNIVLRFMIYYALIMFIVVFGAYGSGYVPLDPIYASF